MANPQWHTGMKAVNPNGRPKNINSVLTTRGLVERFVKRNITPNKLTKMFNSFSEEKKLSFLLELLPYVMAKKSPDSLDETVINQLYEKLDQLKTHAKAS